MITAIVSFSSVRPSDASLYSFNIEIVGYQPNLNCMCRLSCQLSDRRGRYQLGGKKERKIIVVIIVVVFKNWRCR